MAANGISELATKFARQQGKLAIAEAKRQGKTVAVDGTITGTLDNTKPYYRSLNVLDITRLPDTYETTADDNVNTGGLLPGRPWNSVSVYAILALEPSFILDFKASVFNKNGVSSTFGASITHAATTNATMVDSDGLLKWRPHNLISNSTTSTYSRTGILAVGAGSIEDAIAAPDGTITATKLVQDTSTGDHFGYKGYGSFTPTRGGIFIKAGEASKVGFGVGGGLPTQLKMNLITGEINTNTNSVAVTDVGNGWWFVDCDASGGNIISVVVFILDDTYGQSFTGDGTSGIYVWGAHGYRRDLGGMVNNPDASTGFESYVPTTTTAVYLSRRGHHVYNGSAWVNEGILHESEARTNLMTYSGDLTSTDWEWGGGLIVSTVIAGSPFGTYQTISPRNDSSVNLGPAQRYQIGKPITSGSTYVGWALVKYSAGSGWFDINMYDTTDTSKRAYFDVQNGAVGTKDAAIIDHGMVDYGDGWWLCWASANAASTSGGLSLEVPDGDGVLTCTATDVILIAGSQYELGSTASSYIPTVSSTVTRAAETLTVPAANLPYNSTNMSIQMDGKMTYADTNAVETVGFFRWYLNSSNRIVTRLNTNGVKRGNVYTIGVGWNLTDVYSPDVNVPFNIASRHGSTFTNLATDGTAYTASTNDSASATLSATNLNLGDIFMGTIGQFRMWSDDLGDVGITEAST